MGKIESPPATVYPPGDWQALHVGVERCYAGAPVGKSGTFPGTVVTLCAMRKGTVSMSRDGLSVQVESRSKPWLINIPGERTQQFSDDAQIVSVHLSLSNPGNGAEWRGKPMVVAQPDAPARQALDKLQQAALAAGLSPQQLEVRGLPLPLPAALALQAAGSELFGHLLRLTHPLGLRFEIPPIDDPRVRQSHLRLATLPMQTPFSRTVLASEQGLTAGQLDRLWRQELGLTPQQYRDRQRLAFACEQLRLPGASIKAVAADLGFRHLSQFSNWFRARHHESPRDFRNRPHAS